MTKTELQLALAEATQTSKKTAGVFLDTLGALVLVDKGIGVEEVAARFGVTPTTVRQRLKLAHVAPRLFELYRTDEITLDQLMALAITDDHAAQEQVWDSAQEWQRQPQALRRALTETKVDASSDRRALLVGVQAYSHVEKRVRERQRAQDAPRNIVRVKASVLADPERRIKQQ
jgi:ParB-like chromosome segregation protein Spo0J